MGNNKEYFAFICYHTNDERYALQLADIIGHYHLPTKLYGQTDHYYESSFIPENTDDLNNRNVPQHILYAMKASMILIVVCSHKSAKAAWLNQVTEEFIVLHGADKVFPFVTDEGKESDESAFECFPAALKKHLDVNGLQNGIKDVSTIRSHEIVKIIAYIFGFKPDTLWKKYVEDVLSAATADESSVIRFTGKTFFSKEGRLAATAEKGYHIRIWDTETGMTLNEWHLVWLAPSNSDSYTKRNGQFDKLFFGTYCGTDILIICCKENIYVLDYKNGDVIFTYSVGQFWKIVDIIASPDEKFFVCIAEYNNYEEFNPARVFVIDTDSTECVWDTSCSSPVSVSFSSDSKMMALATEKQISILDLLSFKTKHRWRTDEICKCCFTENNTLVYSCSIKLFSCNITFEEIPDTNRILKCDSVISGIISTDSLVALSTLSNTIIVYDIDYQILVAKRQWHEPLRLQSFTEDGTKICFSDDGTLRFWDYLTHDDGSRILYYHPDMIMCMSYSSDKSSIISASDNCIKIWDIKEQKVVHTYFIGGYIDKIVLSSSCDMFFFQNKDGLWSMDIASGCSTQISEIRNDFFSLSPSGEKLSIAKDGKISIYDVRTLQKCFTLDTGYDGAYCMENILFSPSGKLLAVVHDSDDTDQMIASLFDTDTGECIGTNVVKEGFYDANKQTEDEIKIDGFFVIKNLLL